ncbi:MAG: PDDEXK nuclease domain-containing protein [Lentisphaeria bacterium]|nr:PDDEXK nuclease domain-containing protein [Lentisphaeria bacterium]
MRQLHEHLAAKAKHAINISLTLRNWLIGFYIAEYQLHGADRAKYGEQLIPQLAKCLTDLPNCHKRQLYDYLQFYRTWPEILPTVSAFLTKGYTFDASSNKMPTVSALLTGTNDPLLTRLSYSMFKELMSVEDETARHFYETECIHGCWSVRELKRQIGSMLYERTALSSDKRKMTQLANANAEHDTLAMTIRDPYVFDFIGLKAREIVSEKSLEDALIGKLQDFLLELGNGFCFEARQKRILIGDEYFQVDLVFYHRILKCHILIDLKDEPFSHENIGQLNSYVAYYAKHKMTEGDNPPIGILLCTQKNNELVEYALAGLNQKIFVSKYQLELPSKQDMEEFIRHNRAELEQGD